MADKKERGELVRIAINRSGMKMNKVAEKLLVSRPTLNRRLNDPFLDYQFIREVGVVISHDFTEEFPEMKITPSVLAEPIAAYPIDNLDDCKNKLLHVYSLYTDILHKYNDLLLTTAASK